jgi:hypothetical protein
MQAQSIKDMEPSKHIFEKSDHPCIHICNLLVLDFMDYASLALIVVYQFIHSFYYISTAGD